MLFVCITCLSQMSDSGIDLLALLLLGFLPYQFSGICGVCSFHQ